MKLTYNDITLARIWAEENCGDDNPLDVFEHKLLALVAQAAEENAGYHERSAQAARKMMAEIEARFVVSGDVEF